MGKSKVTRRFTTADGKTAKFNHTAFRFTVDKKAREVDRSSGKSRGGKDVVFRQLADGLFHPYNEDHMISSVQRIKNWYYGSNGPDDIENIYMLAEILGCEREFFLKYESEEKTMNTTAIPKPFPVQDGYVIMNSLRSMKEKESAHELYSLFVDLIGAYNKADLDVWVDRKKGSPEWEDAVRSYPDRYPVYLAIQKASLYLSNETRMKAYGLLEDMYGAPTADWDEINQFKSFDCFLYNKHEQFNRYLSDEGIDKNSLDEEKLDWYFTEFIIQQGRDYWYDKLDEVFEEYLCD